MKVKDLIEQLEKFPSDLNVCAFDYKKNGEEADEDGAYSGIYDELSVYKMSGTDIVKYSTPFVAISFKNNRYE